MLRAFDRWLPGYVASIGRRPPISGDIRHLLVCVADHFEPLNCTILPDGTVTGGATASDARAFVDSWCRDYRETLAAFRDADGYSPRHTFFYPWDEYEPGCLDILADFCRDGHGEVEVHLHHRNDTEAGLRDKLIACRDTYANQHGLLGRRLSPSASAADLTAGGGAPAYAFVHGNWCLCNARQDGDWCGVERELSVLAETGCYADLTFPSAPDRTQPRFVNTVYYGRNPGGGERGVQVDRCVGPGGERRKPVDGILMVPGPLGLNWQARKFGIVPKLENAEISGANPATAERLRLWQRLAVTVPGQPDWTIIKLHTHGADPANRGALLGPAMAGFHGALKEACDGDSGWRLHYVTARELFNIIKAAESGHGGNPADYRNAAIVSP